MKTVAVIFGGRSAEHDISIVTALASVIKPRELTKEYQVEPVYIAKNGKWLWDDRLKDIALYRGGKINSLIDSLPSVCVSFDGGMNLVKAGGIGRSKKTKIDIVFPAMHGTYGEDGSLMGLLEMANVPYVGCSQSASVLAMDKVLAKQVTEASGIPVAKYESLSRKDFEDNGAAVTKRMEKALKYPLFVKPAHLGSSIGIGRATNQEELNNAIEVAVYYDDKVIVEEEISNLIEVTLPIMGNEEPIPAKLEKPLTRPEDFFDFETKYLQSSKKGGVKKGGTKGAHGYSEIPAKLPVELYKQAESTGLAVYRALGCSGIARVDLLIDSKANQVYFNEVNPLPGGLYAHNWREAGVSSVELVQRLVEYAVERHAKKEQTTTTFNTNYLQQF